MRSIQMVLVAVVLALGWAGVAAVCFSSIAAVPQNLATVSHRRVAPAAPAVDQKAISVARAEPVRVGR
jgi:Flp pilus assembly protein CpaB